MPALFRSFLAAIVLAGAGYAGLYMMAVHFEPEPKEVRKSVPGLKIQR